MKLLLIIFAVFIVGLSAQSSVVQLHITEILNKCNSLASKIHDPLVKQVRSRFLEVANEFPKITQSLNHGRALLGPTKAAYFVPIDAAISNCFKNMTKDFSENLLKQDFKTILETMVEGFVDYRLTTINSFKKSIDKVVKRTKCYTPEKDAIKKVFEDFYNHSNNAVVDEVNDLDEVLQIIQNRTLNFRTKIAKDIRDCDSRYCVDEYVRNYKIRLQIQVTKSHYQFNSTSTHIVTEINEHCMEAYYEISHFFANLEHLIFDFMQLSEEDFTTIAERIQECFTTVT